MFLLIINVEIKEFPFFAERQGFEPWVEINPTLVFETSLFNHSSISPVVRVKILFAPQININITLKEKLFIR